ncbi:MAG: hypothetical protein WC767_00645 [Candidatus Paceibacterota bacterium]|jgi:hypothetical protein
MSTDKDLVEKVVVQLDDLVRAGRVIVTGGKLKPHLSLCLGISSVVETHGVKGVGAQTLIHPTIHIIDYTKTSNELFQLTFEMDSFGADLLRDKKIDYGYISRSGHIKAADLVASITSLLLMDAYDIIRFDVRPNNVTCLLLMPPNRFILKSVNALEWSQDEKLRHFFELK